MKDRLIKVFPTTILVAVLLIPKDAKSFGIRDWIKIGTCVTSPIHCPIVYKEESEQVIRDASTALAINMGLVEKDSCGNLGDELSESFSTEIFIPDYFPPDETASKKLVDYLIQFGTGVPGFASSMDACIVEGTARLYHACHEHDVCMENRDVFDGDECDNNLLTSWENKCKATYSEYSPCRQACIGVVNASWRVMVENTSDFMATSKYIVPAISNLLLN